VRYCYWDASALARRGSQRSILKPTRKSNSLHSFPPGLQYQADILDLTRSRSPDEIRDNFHLASWTPLRFIQATLLTPCGPLNLNTPQAAPHYRKPSGPRDWVYKRDSRFADSRNYPGRVIGLYVRGGPQHTGNTSRGRIPHLLISAFV
jgi:hypothetical protein